MIIDEGSEKTEAALGLRCPSCQGLLSVVAEPARRGYRCMGGHEFAPPGLLAAGGPELAVAVRRLIQVWEERASGLRQMAVKGPGPAESFDRNARLFEARLAVLRETYTSWQASGR